MLELQLVVPGLPSHRQKLAIGTHTIGRATGADIRLRYDSVAKRHALLCVEQGRCLMRDLGAPDGLRRNGVVVSRIAPVASGDVFDIGECEVKVLQAPELTIPIRSQAPCVSEYAPSS